MAISKLLNCSSFLRLRTGLPRRKKKKYWLNLTVSGLIKKS